MNLRTTMAVMAACTLVRLTPHGWPTEPVTMISLAKLLLLIASFDFLLAGLWMIARWPEKQDRRP